MTSGNIDRHTAEDFRYAQTIAAELYEKGMTASDAADMTESERMLIQRAIEKPSPKALVKFLDHPSIRWKRNKIDEIEMPEIVRIRLEELLRKRDKLVHDG